MISEQLPVFNIDLDSEFQSSDNLFPSSSSNSKNGKSSSDPLLLHNETSTIFSTIGQRKDNLDRCVVLKRQLFSIFALFDGHCDPAPVEFLEKQLPMSLSRHLLLVSQPQKALQEVFEECQKEVIENFERGSTALIVVIIQQNLWVANLGDSKLIGIDTNGNQKDFNICHNFSNQKELKQVIERGGLVLKRGSQYRINGELNLTRCFGNKHLKPYISSKPDIFQYKVKQCKRWILASDGFYNAQELQKRLKVQNFNDLLQFKTVYKDNASAIFLDF